MIKSIKMTYAHTNSKGDQYFLHKKDVTLKGSGKKQTIYFFGRNVQDGAIDDLPQGYQVIESKKTGLPVLKRS